MKISVPFVYIPPLSQWGRRMNASPVGYYKNVLINQNGTISAMPFDTKRLGAWVFDGQVFYQKRLRREIS